VGKKSMNEAEGKLEWNKRNKKLHEEWLDKTNSI